MFIRKKTTQKNPNTYIQLVESYRDDGKPRQRVVKHIGTAINDKQLEHLLKLAEQVIQLYSNNATEAQVDDLIRKELSILQGSRSDVTNCQLIKKCTKSIHDIYGNIFNKIGLDQIISSKSNYSDVLKDIVMARIASPSSKNKACQILEETFNISHSLNSIYRTMDKLDDNCINLMQKKISEYNKKLVSGKINVLFYDATTLYFESFTSDELKCLGYSKDCKFNQPQVVLGLLTTEEGLPLGYQLFPGNMYEGHTLISAIYYWKKLYPEQSFVLVADSGMLNGVNLEYLEQENIDYIVCARLKNLPQSIKTEILERTNDVRNKESSFFDLNFKTRRLVVSYKLERAKKDQFDREKAINALRKKLGKSKNPATLISNYGYKKYITIGSGSKISLNEEKIDEDMVWDGLHGLITNLKGEDAKTIYGHYRNLYQIEDAFRINKSDLKIRPVFHWTPERIKAHIAISYMAYSCYKAVEYIVNRKGKLYSHRQIREHLMKAEAYILEEKVTRIRFFSPFKISNDVRFIYQAMGLVPEEATYRIA